MESYSEEYEIEKYNSSLNKEIIYGNKLLAENLLSRIKFDGGIDYLKDIRNFFKTHNFNKEKLELYIGKSKTKHAEYFPFNNSQFKLNQGFIYHLQTGGCGITLRDHKYVYKIIFEEKEINLYDCTSEYSISNFLYSALDNGANCFINKSEGMILNFNKNFILESYRCTLLIIYYLYKILFDEKNLDFTPLDIKKKIINKNLLNNNKFCRGIACFLKELGPKMPVILTNNLQNLIMFIESKKRYNFNKFNIIFFPLAICSCEKVNEENCSKFGFESLDDYIFFVYSQLIVLYISLLEKNLNFVHMDLKFDNILLFKQSSPIKIQFKNFSVVYNESYRISINDFDYSNIEAYVENIKFNKAKTRNTHYNWFYDFHFFSHMITEYYHIKNTELKNFIKLFISCNKSICNKNRLVVTVPENTLDLETLLLTKVFKKWVFKDLK